MLIFCFALSNPAHQKGITIYFLILKLCGSQHKLRTPESQSSDENKNIELQPKVSGSY